MKKCHICNKSILSKTKGKWVCVGDCYEKYSKQIYSKRILPNNINYYLNRGYSKEESLIKLRHYNKTTSVRCWEYWVNQGYSKEDAIKKVSEIQKGNGIKNKLRGEKALRESSIRCKEYWMKCGYAEEDAIKQVSKIQNLASKAGFCKRYGEKEGLARYESHCYKSTNKYLFERYSIDYLEKRKQKNGGFKPSKSSQELFDMIYLLLDDDLKEKTYYGRLNTEFGKMDTQNKKYYFYDFVITSLKFCVEYNGDCWHANPKKYSQNDTPNPFDKTKTAAEIWEFDKTKNNLLKDLGFDIHYVWESDWKKGNKKEIVDEILEIINGRMEKL